jgi:hypothetical protein
MPFFFLTFQVNNSFAEFGVVTNFHFQLLLNQSKKATAHLENVLRDVIHTYSFLRLC